MTASPELFVFLAFGAVGPTELIFVFVVVLLLFGPKRLPEIAKTIGKVMSEMRRASRDFQDQVMKIEEELPKEEVSSMLNELTDPVALVSSPYSETRRDLIAEETGTPVSEEAAEASEPQPDRAPPPDDLAPADGRPAETEATTPPSAGTEQEEPKQHGLAG